MACAELAAVMSKRHNKHRAIPSQPRRYIRESQASNSGNLDIALAKLLAMDGYAVPSALKTYLQEQVALIRPQISHTEMAHLARFGVTARAATQLRAESLRQVDFVLADADRQEIEPATNQAKAIQRAFNSNFASVIERSEWSYCFYGEVLLRRLRQPSGGLAGFQWINNNFFQTDTSHYDGLLGFHIRAVWQSDLDSDVAYITLPDSVFMHDIDFFDDFGGVGPVEVAYVQAATETEISATQLQFFRNMAMPNFIVQPAEGDGYRVGNDQKNELAEYMRRMGQGSANSGRTFISPTRWDVLKLQQDFDKLGMPSLTLEARNAVLRILRVPIELLEPSQNTKSAASKFYDQKREWLISWLVPQAERYADIFTEQVAKPVNPDWRIVPNFDRVRGLEEDITSRTTNTLKQLADGVLDMRTAQEILGIPTDDNLARLYVVQGVPVPSEEMKNYWRYAPGNPGIIGADTGGEQKETPKTTPKKPTAITETSADEGKKAIPYLGEAAYREFKNWRLVVDRKGTSYEFEGKALPDHAVAFGKMLLAGGGSTDDVWNAIREQATKGYPETEATYRIALYDAMTSAFDGSLDRYKFGVSGRQEIEHAFMSAFKNGLQDGGVDPSEMTDDEKQALFDETAQERTYWTRLAGEMFRDVIPLKGTDAFPAASDKMLGRIELWVNAGLRHVYDMGRGYANLNGMKLWVLDGGVHCASCSAAEGQVHRYRSWAAYLTPRSDSCICTGINCKCSLIDTTERARGSLKSIPLAAMKAHDHEDETVAEVPPELVEAIV